MCNVVMPCENSFWEISGNGFISIGCFTNQSYQNLCSQCEFFKSEMRGK